MIYVVTVSDTITYERKIEITVDAADEDEAATLALDKVDDELSTRTNYEEEQIDNTPYEVIAVHT